MSYTYSGIQVGSPARLTVDGAWGVKLLNPLYTGPLIRVRRSNDNAEQDIGRNGTELDTAALTTFTGANSGFIVKAYDQSVTNTLDATQSTSGNQPRIVNAGTVDTISSKIAWLHDGTDDYLTLGTGTGGNLDSALTAYTWVAEYYANSETGFPGLVCKGNLDSSSSGSYIMYFTGGNSFGYLVYSGSTRVVNLVLGAGNFPTGSWHQVATTWQASVVAEIYQDGVFKTNDTSPGASIDAAGQSVLFGSGQGNAGNTVYPFSGYIRSVRLYRRALTAGQLAGLFAKGI